MRGLVIVCGAIVAGWLLTACYSALYLDGREPVMLERMFEPPDARAWLGHDDLGRPLALRVATASAVSCGIAFAVVSTASVLGLALGLFLGWNGGLVDLVGVRIMDVFLAFPGILLAIALAAMLGPGIENVALALVAVSWVGFARLARAQTLSLKHRDHVAVARALGIRSPLIAVRHVLPLIAAPLIVEATFALAAVVIAEAGLSFLGLGVQPPTPSWGSLIKDGTDYLLVAPHMVVGPGLALFSLVMAFNVLGDALRDRWQVKGRAGAAGA